ncbi:MAG: hypothetical protein A3G33_04380 [Omnitrophica bacterium RIFCSPLOWO2_12_FULL_44_17]|uniref:ABC transporter domain-containing protein n=1 Tax=Candidatus Danuiimicrobium aquiferis TaxID=1801832 RepID=A0A1G1KQR2_9BACT|nr:MAG: hypothetical protein A3B72_10590 [Omnitrophica bacterium RIFCSPHIGHO2_02_FULL_45_28]OGW92462.1 MAG: hypothetical protein A3E74_03905 [Omnitrophica bacterium RIFCSPHIGHO2_12_FULL_44_12]OGW95172.1 MAG: hypothetical protein A3G33_04380 [Omnitrophica bacterium RIFCSPLOWO2_12_FULL_44_17]OGX01683.1 MAG: hypothetical protein A3J12_04055 [Omnitrophica bacterium RIFCSPLOWO2_02_FULL_44_11]
MVLTINHLTCGYGRKIVLDDIHFSIQKGEFLGIIGPNGSGKTTLLRSLTRVVQPVKGEILFEGEAVGAIQPKQLAKKIAVASQSLFEPHMLVEDFVLLGRIPHYQSFQLLETKKDFEVAERVMRLAGVSDLRNAFMDEISSGERQLVVIARALAQEPSLLLLDEPTAHLDITHQVQIMDLIKRLNQTLGLTVIVVLHDLNLASEYCRRLLLIKSGRVHKLGEPRDVLNAQTIEEVYRTRVHVEKNPLSSKPYILLTSEE